MDIHGKIQSALLFENFCNKSLGKNKTLHQFSFTAFETFDALLLYSHSPCGAPMTRYQSVNYLFSSCGLGIRSENCEGFARSKPFP